MSTESVNQPQPPERRRGGRRLALGVVGLLIVSALLGGRWYYLHRLANWGVVEPGRLYRSALVPRPLLREKLTENKIAVILNLSNDTEGGADLAAEKSLATELGISRRDLPLNGDGLGKPATYIEALTAICRSNAQGQAVLVHCHSGAQRTGGVIAAYRMLVENKPSAEAYAEMLRYGYDPKGNPQLVRFLNENMKQWAIDLHDRGLIDRVPPTIPQIVP